MGNTVVLLYIIIITFGYSQTQHDCLYVQPPPNTNGSMIDHQQVTPLSYCIIDNCTIMRIDTGETLEVVYTANSLAMVTSTDGQTSIVISEDETALPCLTPYSNGNNGQAVETIIRLILTILIAVVSGYISLVHMLFKEIRTPFGKLLMFHSFALIFQCINGIMLVSVHIIVAPHSQVVCQIMMFIYMQGTMTHEAFATCILAFLDYVMYSSHKVKEVSKKLSKKLLKRCLIYVFSSLGFLCVIILSYDFITGNQKHLLLSDGHCAFNDIEIYETLVAPYFYATLNKMLQIIFFIIYLYYFHKFNSENAILSDLNRRLNKNLTRIAFAFGAAIGLSQVTWIVGNLTGYRSYARLVGAFFLLMQQFVIMTTLVCTEETSQLWKKFSSKVQPST